MQDAQDWRRVYDFWFPAGLDANLETHGKMFLWWMRGGASAEMARFSPVLEAALAGRLDAWRDSPRGRLSLILVLDQFTRGLHAGAPRAYAGDQAALQLAREGVDVGHCDALTTPWEQLFFYLPYAHAEGPDHLQRAVKVVELAELAALTAPIELQPIYKFSASQARANLEVITRFKRFPHRNPILGRVSTPEELAFFEKGDFVHNRQPAFL